MKVELQIPELQIHLGETSDSLDQALQKAEADNLVERTWARDHTLWNPNPTEITNRLGWLDIAERMRAEVAGLQEFVRQVRAEGFSHALLLGMGGSSLAPEVFGHFFSSGQELQLGVLDSTDPDAVRACAKPFNPKETLYIVSTKSGGTVETLSFFKYFYNQAQNVLGNQNTGKHFIAITDPGSSLEEIAKKRSFRHIFLADPNIGGRYAALSHFGLLPGALIGVDLSTLLDRAAAMAQRCSAATPLEENPGALLGLVLGALALQGRNKLTFIAPDSLATFGDWAEQLVAESTGKQGKGILPVVGEPPGKIQDYGQDRVFIYLSTQGNKELGKRGQELIAAGMPLIEIPWEDEYDLGGQFFLWEFAIAVTGHVLGINPFDQPNVEAAKVQARCFVEEYTTIGRLPKGKGQPVSAQALKTFLKQADPGDYVSLQVYAAPSKEADQMLSTLRSNILKTYNLATTLSYGPRFLHSAGQLHKGDAGKGLFVQFVTLPPKEDVLIPKQAGSAESEIGFGALKVAQALGDAQALRQAGRRVLSFEIDGDLVPALQGLLADLEKGS